MFQHHSTIHRLQNGASVLQSVELVWLRTVWMASDWSNPAFISLCEDPQPEWLTQSQQSITDVVLITSEEAITGDSFLASHTVTRVGQSIIQCVKTRAIYWKKSRLTQHTLLYIYTTEQKTWEWWKNWVTLLLRLLLLWGKLRKRLTARRHGRLQIEISWCHFGRKREPLSFTLGSVGTECL